MNINTIIIYNYYDNSLTGKWVPVILSGQPFRLEILGMTPGDKIKINGSIIEIGNTGNYSVEIPITSLEICTFTWQGSIKYFYYPESGLSSLKTISGYHTIETFQGPQTLQRTTAMSTDQSEEVTALNGKIITKRTTLRTINKAIFEKITNNSGNNDYQVIIDDLVINLDEMLTETYCLEPKTDFDQFTFNKGVQVICYCSYLIKEEVIANEQ